MPPIFVVDKNFHFIYTINNGGNMKKIDQLNKKINELEIKAKVYSDNYGADSDEVKAIDKQAMEIKLQILDIMCPDGCLIEF